MLSSGDVKIIISYITCSYFKEMGPVGLRNYAFLTLLTKLICAPFME